MEPLGSQLYPLIMRRRSLGDADEWSGAGDDRSSPPYWPGGLVRVGQQVSLQTPPVAGLPGSVVVCEVVDLSPPYASLVPLEGASYLRVGVPVVVNCTIGG